MAILEHLIPNAEQHLSAWRQLLKERSDKIISLLDRIADAVEDSPDEDRMKRFLSDVVVIGTDGTGVINMRAPAGYEWEASLLACTGTSGGGAALYFSGADASSLLWAVDNAGLHSDILPDIPVPAGVVLVVRFFNMTSGDTASARVLLTSTRTHQRP